VLEQVEAAYPPAAGVAGVDGEVRFHAVIAADGQVQRVDIQSVPQEGLGFEDAVRAAVLRWRFAPALVRGTPVESDYIGVLRFTLSLPGEAMFSASSRDTWRALRAMMRQLRVPVDKANDKTQLLTTSPMRYGERHFPNAATSDLPDGFKPHLVTIHAYVTPGREPARVSVGSVMELDPIAPNGVQRLTVYRHDGLARWFLAELARRMGSRMERTSASAEGRAEQSRRLMPPGLTDPCMTAATIAASFEDGAAEYLSAVTPPQMLYRISPVYPADQLYARQTAVIKFHGEITEHGTLVNPSMTEPADAPASFVAAAQLAFAQWRFTPAVTKADFLPRPLHQHVRVALHTEVS
jgi:TonB family protein